MALCVKAGPVVYALSAYAARQEVYGSHPVSGTQDLISSRPPAEVFETFTDVSLSQYNNSLYPPLLWLKPFPAMLHARFESSYFACQLQHILCIFVVQAIPA